MGQSQSTPEKIFKLARSGKSTELRILLLDLQRNDRYYQSNRSSYLEVQDEAGNTALTACAAHGHYSCVQILIEQGASLHHQNRRGDGGSALHEAVAHRHDQVVELLLRCGASPFTENVKGFTAMDIACAARNVPMVRRLEQVAPFAGWLLMKVPKFAGLGSTWERRWCVVCHRFPYPHAPPAQQLTHVVFLAYKSDTNTTPACRAWLDGAKAREFYHPNAVARITGQGPAQAAIILHRKHDSPAGAYVTGKGPAGEGYTFYLRPIDGDQAALSALQLLMDLINNRGFAPPPRPSTASTPAAAAAHLHYPAVGQMATTPGVWTAGPLAQGVASVAATAGGPAADDEDYARRLQEQYDQEAAAHLANTPQAEIPASATPSYSSATTTPAAEGSGDLHGDGRYPRPFAVGSVPSTVPLTPTAGAGAATVQRPGAAAAAPPPLYSSTSAPTSLNVAAAAAGPEQLRQESPSAPPLISLDSPRLEQPAMAVQHAVSAPATDTWWQDLPPGPTSRPLPAAGAAQEPRGDEEDNLCVICMDSEATAGVLHGETVHKCLCRPCAQGLKDANTRNCPMCREPIEAFIMHVY